MSIVAISQTLGSLGEEIGRQLAQTLSWQCADREIILEAASRFGEGVMTLEHFTEEKPSLWERFSDTHHRYQTFVETIILEMAARDNLVISGRGSSLVLRRVRHALKVRVIAPELLRARRIEVRQGLTAEAAEHLVRQSDRERAARLKFLFHVDWEDPLLYDMTLNTERVDGEEACHLVRELLVSERFRPTAESLAEVGDLSLAARARATLMTNPETRRLALGITCRDGWLTVSGGVDREQQRKTVEEALAGIPGARGVQNEVVVTAPAMARL
ncbi:MAG: cytidylate kinase family protein [Candidatus Rokubacteria bacterium]|nr:cytidylate kinase family protein [Candidatus Rokubacteria bacterium]